MKTLLLAASLVLALAIPASAQNCDGDPGFVISVPPTIGLGEAFSLTVDAPPGTTIYYMASMTGGPTPTPFGEMCLGFPFFYGITLTIPASGHLELPCFVECFPDWVGFTAYLQFLGVDPNEPGVIKKSNGTSTTIVDNGSCDVGPICLVIIDEETIDNDIKTIEAAAASHDVEPDWLVNDHAPTLGANPPLNWNQYHAGDIVLLPAGQVDDEGIFALPEDIPFSLENYVAGFVPQSQLDKIPEVMPLRNQDLHALIGLTCAAVVYDSDISMNYVPILGNLQGERYGIFTFTVLDVVVPGTLAESGSSSSLYDLLVRVEEPLIPTFAYTVDIHDHEPDSLRFLDKEYDNGVLTVAASSDFGEDSIMTVSVDGLFLEASMSYSQTNDRFEYSIASAENLQGRRILISTDHGGSYSDFID